MSTPAIDIIFDKLEFLTIDELELLQNAVQQMRESRIQALPVLAREQYEETNHISHETINWIPQPTPDFAVELKNVENEFKKFLFANLKHYDKNLVKPGLILDFVGEKFGNDTFMKCCSRKNMECQTCKSNLDGQNSNVFKVASHFTVCDNCIHSFDTRDHMRNSLQLYVDEYLAKH